MSADRAPVTGPFRITPEPIPAGITLDVESFVRAVITDVVDALLEDDGFDTLVEIRDQFTEGTTSLPTAPERLLAEQLIADLVDASATKIPVYGAQCLALADRIRALAAAKAVPSQREAGAA